MDGGRFGVLAWHFPMADMEIQNGAALAVLGSRRAVFIAERHGG